MSVIDDLHVIILIVIVLDLFAEQPGQLNTTMLIGILCACGIFIVGLTILMTIFIK